MALTHDVSARLMQAAAQRRAAVRRALRLLGQALPAPEPLLAETEVGSVRVQIYRPEGVENPPVYLNFHGGGFVIRTPEQDDHICRHLVAELGCVVVNVDYDVAPQHRFPVAPTQAQAVAWWAVYGGRTQGWDGKRIALGGQAAGGNLALGVCLELPARMGVRPKGVVANYPVLDLDTPPEAKPAPRAGSPVSARIARMFTAAYLPDAAARAAPLASPLNAPDLAGFPPTLLTIAEHDRLAAEAERFAERLRAKGTGLRVHREMADHGFMQRGPRAAVGRTLGAMVDFLRGAFAG